MRKRGAFLDQFKREAKFKDDLSELDDARDVVDSLVQEYEAATQADYLNWQGMYHLLIVFPKSYNRFMYFCYHFSQETRESLDLLLLYLEFIINSPTFSFFK